MRRVCETVLIIVLYSGSYNQQFCRAKSQISGGYCWSFPFHTTRLLVRRWILEIFRPSTTTYAKHYFRYVGDDQQYPGVIYASVLAQPPFVPTILSDSGTSGLARAFRNPNHPRPRGKRRKTLAHTHALVAPSSLSLIDMASLWA